MRARGAGGLSCCTDGVGAPQPTPTVNEGLSDQGALNDGIGYQRE
jgi:hypothetical protein